MSKIFSFTSIGYFLPKKATKWLK